MANVSVSSSIKAFAQKTQTPNDVRKLDPDYLLRREMAERAAAKRSETEAGRRAHQELASVFASLRHHDRGAD